MSPTQIAFIHQLIQSRLQDNPNPLQETYMVLHSFCQSLQLEVLFTQTQKVGKLEKCDVTVLRPSLSCMDFIQIFFHLCSPLLLRAPIASSTLPDSFDHNHLFYIQAPP